MPGEALSILCDRVKWSDKTNSLETVEWNGRVVCNRDPASWPTAMHSVMFAHNTSVNKTTRMLPYELVFKQQAKCPETFFLPKVPVSSDEEWKRGCPCKSGTFGHTKIRQCLSIW